VKAAEKAAHLTQQLLAYAGKGRFVSEKIDLSVLVREISELVQSSISKTVQIRLELEDRLPAVEADPGQIQQVIMNLVINGAEAIGEAVGTVLVTTGSQMVDEEYIRNNFMGEPLEPGPYVTLEVHDTGAGMDEAVRSRIFDPFFTTKFTGRGLGLSAVLGIVRAHKGTIRVYSEPGRGSSFKILLPAAAGAARAPGLLDPHEELRGSGLVLVVDDEEVVRSAAAAALRRYGYTTLTANDGAEGVKLFRERDGAIDLVLLDMTMPVMSGEEAFRQMRQFRPDVRVIVSSGYNEVEAIRRFTAKGIAAFIQKPYSAASLARIVKKTLGK
jgi:CheY-like chemotaxis protein